MVRMRRVNVDGVIHTIRAAAPGMQERSYGRIINIASNAAIGTALPGTTFYAATKAEVLILTRRFAMELGRRGITVNAVAPGWIVTEMAQAGRSEQDFEARGRDMGERTMVGRAGRAGSGYRLCAWFMANSPVRSARQFAKGGRIDHAGHSRIGGRPRGIGDHDVGGWRLCAANRATIARAGAPAAGGGLYGTNTGL